MQRVKTKVNRWIRAVAAKGLKFAAVVIAIFENNNNGVSFFLYVYSKTSPVEPSQIKII